MPNTSIHKFLNLLIKINSEFYDTDTVDKENITMKMSDSISVHKKGKAVKKDVRVPQSNKKIKDMKIT